MNVNGTMMGYEATMEIMEGYGRWRFFICPWRKRALNLTLGGPKPDRHPLSLTLKFLRLNYNSKLSTRLPIARLISRVLYLSPSSVQGRTDSLLLVRILMGDVTIGEHKNSRPNFYGCWGCSKSKIDIKDHSFYSSWHWQTEFILFQISFFIKYKSNNFGARNVLGAH